MDDPEHPGLDADASEIQEWMEEDFASAVAEGMENATDERTPVEVEIINQETGEGVGTIDTGGTLEAEN